MHPNVVLNTDCTWSICVSLLSILCARLYYFSMYTHSQGQSCLDLQLRGSRTGTSTYGVSPFDKGSVMQNDNISQTGTNKFDVTYIESSLSDLRIRKHPGMSANLHLILLRMGYHILFEH